MVRVCRHLNDHPGSEYAEYFTGVGIEHALVCLACCAALETIEAHLMSVSPERFAEVQKGVMASEEGAILGRPEVLERPSGLSFRHEEVAQAGACTDRILELKPIPNSRSGECLILTERGDLILADPNRGSVRTLLNIRDAGTTLAESLSFHASPKGDMAAVVEKRGRRGVVFDLRTARPTMGLDRGDYHCEQTEFPVVFFETGDELRLVHGTDWNRLDVSDPRTGCLLTDRSPTSYRQGEERPAHYLDYFHGSLTISPNGARITDNGWVWHPSGVVVTWSLRRWLETDPWESEDGPSKRALCYRLYFWEGPLCWIDDRTLAVWGYGKDDEELIPAALIFDVESAECVRWFAGPVGTFAYDGYLFSSSAEAGTSVWDIKTGERLLHDAEYRPTVYHPGAKRFISVTPSGGLRLSRLVGE